MFSSWLSSVASLSDSVVAQLPSVVKTTLDEFVAEKDRYAKETKTYSEADVRSPPPPWQNQDKTVEEEVKRQVLALSSSKRNFLEDPPADYNFPFSLSEYMPVAKVCLEQDPALAKLRFALVPQQIKEEVFWRNYFYRVSIINNAFGKSKIDTTAPSTPAEQNDNTNTNINTNTSNKDNDNNNQKDNNISNTNSSTTTATTTNTSNNNTSNNINNSNNNSDINSNVPRTTLNVGGTPVHTEPSSISVETSESKDEVSWEAKLEAELGELGLTSEPASDAKTWEEELERELKAELDDLSIPADAEDSISS
jgi:hypothetical protein